MVPCLSLSRESTFDSEKPRMEAIIEFHKVMLYTMGLMSCTNTVLVASPCHPLFPLALMRNRPAGSTTKIGQIRILQDPNFWIYDSRICDTIPP